MAATLAKATWLKDENGEFIAPKTLASCVFDENGEPIASEASNIGKLNYWSPTVLMGTADLDFAHTFNVGDITFFSVKITNAEPGGAGTPQYIILKTGWTSDQIADLTAICIPNYNTDVMNIRPVTLLTNVDGTGEHGIQIQAYDEVESLSLFGWFVNNWAG